MAEFNTSWIIKMVVAILAMFAINAVACTWIEYNDYRDQQDSLTLFMRHSADYTRVNLQTISSTNYTGTSSSISKDKIKPWVDSVRSQARSNGTMTPWLDSALNKIQSTAGRLDMFTPLNFGLTYLAQEDYQAMFEESLQKLVEYNYGTDSPPLSGNTDWGSVIIDDVRVTVSDPIVRNLASDNTLLKSIFGSPSVDMGEFLYVITYNVHIEVDWSHVSTTPFFKAPVFDVYSGPVSHLQGQAMFRSGQPLVIDTTYVLTN